MTENEQEARDAGRALIEVVILGVLVLIPTLYILIALLRIQAATLAVNQAARDAGRAMDAAATIDVGEQRARDIAVVALGDQHVPSDDLSIRYVRTGSDCDSPQIVPTLSGGDVYDICVRVTLSIPGVPTVMTGSRNTVTGVYTLHVGELREGR